MFNRFKLTVGDKHCDGHGRYEEFTIQTKLNFGEVSKLYEEDIKESFGIDVSKISSEYLDTKIPEDVLNVLQKLDFNFDDYDIDIWSEEVDGISKNFGSIYMPKGLFDIVVFLMNKAYGEKVIYIVKATRTPTIDIGGYGLFG